MYADVCTFVQVYIKEAHPQDGWSFGEEMNDGWGHVKYATAIADRLAVAKAWIEKVGAKAPYYCDTMADTMRLSYEAWPERLYVIDQGKIALKGGPGPFQYDIGEVEAWLKSRFPSKA